MKVMSSPEERIVDESNSTLFSLIPVIYGAVFSYAMYVFSEIIVKAYSQWDLQKIDNDHIEAIFSSNSAKQILLFACFTIYMIQDVGSIIKIGTKYPFRRTSRYTFEIFIALLYICTFSLLGAGIYYCVISFSILVLLGGVWHNQFKEEYTDDDSNVRSYSKNERDLHYIGAGVLLFIGFFFANEDRSMTWLNVCLFCVVLFLWMFFSAQWLCMRHGAHVVKCRIMIFLPDHYVRKISTQVKHS